VKPSSRRRLDWFWLGAGCLVLAVVAAFASFVSDGERMVLYQVHARVDADGRTRIEEAVDWDFGVATDKHGIFRDVPGLAPDADVQVESDAPSGVQITGEHIRIGDPDQTVSGRERYVISYSLDGLAPEGLLSWDAVGVEWEADIERAHVVVTGPFDWSGVTCSKGSTGSTGGCTVRQTTPGRLDVTADDFSPGTGLTITARSATPIGEAPSPPAFEPAAPNDGQPLLPFFLAALVASVVAAIATSSLVRRAGREWVGPGGAADAAFVGVLPGDMALDASFEGEPPGATRIDAADLAELSTVEFSPPPGMSAAMGGIVLRESVKPEHKVAWLIEQVGGGAVALDDVTGTQRLIRTGAPDRRMHPVLDRAFSGRSEIELGSYDAAFAGAWSQLDDAFTTWRKGCGLWDPRGDRAQLKAIVGGILLGLVGIGGTFLGGFVGSVPVVVVSALLAGAALALVVRAWELRVRSVQGSAAWLRVESFRRFLHESEVQHVDWATQNGHLREYTAWAVAVGEIDRWQAAVGRSTVAASMDPGSAHLVFLAPALISSTGSTSTAPSSSGGGGGGGVGGGGGGGGGGSW
jgi:hypothetical protein